MAKATTKKTVTRKRRERKNIEKGSAHICSTFNNTIVFLGKISCNLIHKHSYFWKD